MVTTTNLARRVFYIHEVMIEMKKKIDKYIRSFNISGQ